MWSGGDRATEKEIKREREIYMEMTFRLEKQSSAFGHFKNLCPPTHINIYI